MERSGGAALGKTQLKNLAGGVFSSIAESNVSRIHWEDIGVGEGLCGSKLGEGGEAVAVTEI